MKIEGKNSVRELLRTKKTIDKILIANGMRDEESKNLLNIIVGREYALPVIVPIFKVLVKQP